MRLRGCLATVSLLGVLLSWRSVEARPVQAPPMKPEALTAIQQEAITLYRAGRYDHAAARYHELASLQPENVEILKDFMWVLWRAGRNEEAARVAATITSLDQDDIEAWNFLGRELLVLGRHDEALDAFEQSLRADPEQRSVWRAVAQLHLDTHQAEQAHRLLTQWLRQDPEAGELYPLLARAQSLQGNFEAAADSWAQARRFFPENLAYHYQYAAALYHSGQVEQARTALETLLREQQQHLLDPNQVDVWKVIAQLQMDLEQYDAAQQLLTELLQRYPDRHDLYPLLATTQNMQEQFADAAATWAKAREAFPDNLAYHYREAVAWDRSGQAEHTLVAADALVKRHRHRLSNPADLGVWRLVAQLYLNLERYEAAERLLTDLVWHHPDRGEPIPLLARAQSLQGNFEAAADSWAQARRFFPENLDYHYQHAAALYHSDQPKQAQRSLEELGQQHRKKLLDPMYRNVWRLIAQLWLNLRQPAQASRLLEVLVEHDPHATSLYPVLARAYMRQGDMAQAARYWATACQFFPDNPDYQYQYASALFHSGQSEPALARFTELAAHHADYDPAVDWLADYAIVKGEEARAAQLLESRLANPKPGDEPVLLRLAELYAALGQRERALATLDRCLALNPTEGEALLQKAEHFTAMGRLRAAATIYQELLTWNPWSRLVLTRLADVQYVRGRYAQAVRVLKQARQFDATDPYWLIKHAQALYALGNVSASKRLLTQWLQKQDGPVLLILCYHGLIASHDDPLLAQPYHITVEAFEDQIRTLAEAGFVAVTAQDVHEWYRGTKELPDRPVLITFDDARLDSFEPADPILARYHFKATMCVPIINLARHLSGYASWEQLAQYQRTGRWEIQAHGGYAHGRIPIDAEGRKGIFLTNRQWLAEEQRLETVEEWRDRIAMDYRLSKLAIEQHLGTVPVAFAYPEGDFGQQYIQNVPKAAPINVALVRQTFGLALHQNPYGLNVRSQDPMFLTRVEPRTTWTGKDLLWHVAHKNPIVLAHGTLFKQAAWQGRFREAAQWLEQLRQDGVSPSLLLVEQARLHYAAGDSVQGRALIDQALQTEHSAEVAHIAQAIQQDDDRWVWTPYVEWKDDNQDREHVLVSQRLGEWEVGQSQWTVAHRTGMFREAGLDDVLEHGLGLSSRINLGLFHSLQLDGMAHLFSGGQAEETVTASGSLRSRWTDAITTGITAGQGLVETARALDANIRDRYATLQAIIGHQDPWQLATRANASDLSDDNRRYTATAELSNRLEVFPSLRLIYRFTVDDTDTVSPNYYSPQQLMLHQGGAEYELSLGKRASLIARYLPGYGTEEGVSARLIHTVEAEAPIRWTDTFQLRPRVFLSRTPTYEANLYSLSLQIRF